MCRASVELITLTLPDGRELKLQRNYVYTDDGMEPAGIEPRSARAFLNGTEISVDSALELVKRMRDDAEKRSHG